MSGYQSLGGGDPNYIRDGLRRSRCCLTRKRSSWSGLSGPHANPVTKILRLLPDGTVDHSFSGPRGRQAAISPILAGLAFLGGGGMLVRWHKDHFALDERRKPQAGYITKFDAQGSRVSSFGAAHNGGVGFPSEQLKWTSPTFSASSPWGPGKIKTIVAIEATGP